MTFECSKLERKIITRLAVRAAKLATKYDIKYSIIDAEMDLTATHVNGCPLDLEKMEAAPDVHFGHVVDLV